MHFETNVHDVEIGHFPATHSHNLGTHVVDGRRFLPWLHTEQERRLGLGVNHHLVQEFVGEFVSWFVEVLLYEFISDAGVAYFSQVRLGVENAVS